MILKDASWRVAFIFKGPHPSPPTPCQVSSKLSKEPQLTDTHGLLPHSHYIVPILLLLTKKRKKADEEKEDIFARNVHVIRVLFSRVDISTQACAHLMGLEALAGWPESTQVMKKHNFQRHGQLGRQQGRRDQPGLLPQDLGISRPERDQQPQVKTLISVWEAWPQARPRPFHTLWLQPPSLAFY